MAGEKNNDFFLKLKGYRHKFKSVLKYKNKRGFVYG